MSNIDKYGDNAEVLIFVPNTEKGRDLIFVSNTGKNRESGRGQWAHPCLSNAMSCQNEMLTMKRSQSFVNTLY